MNRDDALRVLREPLAQELLDTQYVARLAYNGVDGYPRAIPIGYYWTGHQFVVCTASGAPKVAAMQANPKVALTIDTEGQPPHILLVRGSATVAIVDGIPWEFLEASRRYIPPENWQDYEAQTRALYPQMARIAISPEWAKLLDFETRLPIAIERLIAQCA
ncbi:MAG TPA: pyridoxamine 5'-phosphate oxidase family protein [Candidatus Dormibacteraeota bacterium]